MEGPSHATIWKTRSALATESQRGASNRHPSPALYWNPYDGAQFHPRTMLAVVPRSWRSTSDVLTRPTPHVTWRASPSSKLLPNRMFLAEREGFEPPIRLPVCRISSAVHSTTLPPLRPPVKPDFRGCALKRVRCISKLAPGAQEPISLKAPSNAPMPHAQGFRR